MELPAKVQQSLGAEDGGPLAAECAVGGAEETESGQAYVDGLDTLRCLMEPAHTAKPAGAVQSRV